MRLQLIRIMHHENDSHQAKQIQSIYIHSDATTTPTSCRSIQRGHNYQVNKDT